VIREFPLQLGQSVAAGELIGTVAVPEAEAKLGQARAQLAEAERVVARERGLLATGASTSDASREAESRLALARAATAEAQAQVAHTQVRAPFAGVVVETYLLAGDLATPGRPWITLEASQPLRAEGALPESQARALRVGDVLRVRLAEGLVSEGRIAELSPAADALTHSHSVKVTLPSGQGHSGQWVQLLAPAGEVSGYFVPADALRTFGQMEQVFVVGENRARLRIVKSGRRDGNTVEIVAGLQPAEIVVMRPPTALRDGDAVKIAP
jgi:RND family efflux transporter MFP subunit